MCPDFGTDFLRSSLCVWHIPFFHSAVLFSLYSSDCTAVCQKQIFIPNNSLLYCSEKCKQEDALSSSPPLSLRPLSQTSLTKTTFELSRKDEWGIPPSPTPAIMVPSSPTVGTSPTARSVMHRFSSSRPLPPLHPRTPGTSPRSMELVLPVYREASAPTVVESKSLDYDRRRVEGNTAQAGGLKKLFHFKELQQNTEN